LPYGAAGWRRGLARNTWTLGVWLLLSALLVWYATLIPVFGQFQITSISKNSLPLVYLAIGQAIIVVTLATGYIWSGFALWILPSPGGGTAPEFRWLFTGAQSGIGGTYVMPILMMMVPAIVVFLLSRRTRVGLSIYAIGSDSVAARLAGLDVRRAKMASYAIGGAMAALAGLATVALTGTGDPRFSVGANATLNSVAAVVLGGVALVGGTGLVLGAVAAGVILIMLNPILSAMGIDPNNAQIIQGLLIAGVMMVGGLVTLLRERSA
jgi:ribose transport system permease protein